MKFAVPLLIVALVVTACTETVQTALGTEGLYYNPKYPTAGDRMRCTDEELVNITMAVTGETRGKGRESMRRMNAVPGQREADRANDAAIIAKYDYNNPAHREEWLTDLVKTSLESGKNLPPAARQRFLNYKGWDGFADCYFKPKR